MSAKDPLYGIMLRVPNFDVAGGGEDIVKPKDDMVETLAACQLGKASLPSH